MVTSQNSGFTLLGLMAVVAITAVAVLIAVPSLQESRKSAVGTVIINMTHRVVASS